MKKKKNKQKREKYFERNHSLQNNKIGGGLASKAIGG